MAGRSMAVAIGRLMGERLFEAVEDPASTCLESQHSLSRSGVEKMETDRRGLKGYLKRMRLKFDRCPVELARYIWAV